MGSFGGGGGRACMYKRTIHHIAAESAVNKHQHQVLSIHLRWRFCCMAATMLALLASGWMCWNTER